jgi:peptidoglycan hydrolase-like protein with peptidoglycan-binding domain
MNRTIVLTVVLALVFVAGARGDEPTVAEVTHWELQAVDEDGVGTYDATDKVIISGIVLNNPEEMLNPTPGTGYMGGQWQIYIQGEDGDHAGTAVWYGQYYAKVGGSGNYTDEELLDELCRINTDPNTGYVFAAGDRVKVTGWYKFYKGKINVNEKHQIEPMFDFEVELIQPAVGLPEPEVITLNQVKDVSDDYIFDSSRLTGCEYYQGRLVRVNDVNVIDPENWSPDNTITITDANGLTFPVKLGIGDGFTRFDCPTGQISVIAILDQESSGYMVCKDGYRLWVVDYDGNGLVLTDRGHERGNLPGDINTDYQVDFYDFIELAGNWLQQRAGLSGCDE